MRENAEWKWLWKIQAPPKAKHLLWRICKGCLPTRTRLKERRAWQSAGIDSIGSPTMLRFNTVKEWILNFCRNSDCNEAGKAAMLLWHQFNEALG
ncbi:hypothetical protein L195_g060140 [Trifolium pratense]|uniref:Reverse transcriptase zinc-binding domain-containing protein n=1 Tax=Trifolium pratense TaxID=57577 RepID=A0A2K3K223_TRIPR|nr:hypothetical protein L195_g060140 [Trifolium pratense]